MVHDSHDSILVPPFWVLDTLNLASHDNDLASWNQFAPAVSRSQMLGNSGRCNVVTVQRLSKAVDHLGPLTSGENVWWARCQNEVAVEIDDKRIGWRSEKASTLSGNTEDIRTWLLDQFLRIAGMHNRDVQSTPLVNTNAEADSLCSHGKDRWVVADEDDAASGRYSRLNYSHNVGDRETSEQWPHRKVLETSWGRRELVAKCVVLHVDTDKVVQSRRRETEDTGDLFSVEQVGCFVPVDPHASKVITQQVVERVSRQETQAVRDPVGLVGRVVEIRLCLLAQIPDGLCTLLICSGPDTEGNSVQGVRGVLLQDEGVVNAMGLALACAYFNIVRETSLLVVN